MHNKYEICRNCKNVKRDIKKGILCSITDKKPDFEDECSLFISTEENKENLDDDKPVITITTRWKCPNCSEINEDSFEFCWNCQTNRNSECEIIEEKHVGKSKKQLVFEEKAKKGSGWRFIIESFLIAFWVGAFGVLFNSFFGWRLRGVNGNVLPDEPELMFFFLVLYDILYIINYYTIDEDIRKEAGFSLISNGVYMNIALIIFFLIGIIFL